MPEAIWTKNIRGLQLKCLMTRDVLSRILKYVVIVRNNRGRQYKVATIDKDGNITRSKFRRSTTQGRLIDRIGSDAIDVALAELKDYVSVNGIMDA